MRHVVLEAEEQGIVAGSAVVAEVIHVVGERVEGNTVRYACDVGVGLDDGVMRYAGRVSDGGDELMAKVVLGIEREVLGVGCGQMGGKGSEADAAIYRETGTVKAADGIRVWRKAEERARGWRDGVDDRRIDGSWAAAGERSVDDARRIVVCVACDGDLFLVVVESEAAAEDEFIVECDWAPGEPGLGAEVALLGTPEVASVSDREAREGIGP